jgi:hypothetical protein
VESEFTKNGQYARLSKKNDFLAKWGIKALYSFQNSCIPLSLQHEYDERRFI